MLWISLCLLLSEAQIFEVFVSLSYITYHFIFDHLTILFIYSQGFIYLLKDQEGGTTPCQDSILQHRLGVGVLHDFKLIHGHHLTQLCKGKDEFT